MQNFAVQMLLYNRPRLSPLTLLGCKTPLMTQSQQFRITRPCQRAFGKQPSEICSKAMLLLGPSASGRHRTRPCDKVLNMSKFDPEHERRILLGDCGFEFDLAADISQAKTTGGRGSSSHAFLGTAIRCLLNGLDEPAFQLLKKAQQWVSVALAEEEIPKRFLHDERYSPDGEAALRNQTLAMTNWLLNGQHDAESYRRFVECEDRFLGSSELGKDKVSISLLLPIYVDAGVYQRALERFASSRLTAPKSCGPVRNESQMAYVLCRYRLGEDFTETEVSSVTGTFLDSNVDGWLTSGHFVRAAEWMKIVYWREGKAGISAKEALLKCYDHLSDCSLPS
jgi:hypothetical protein